MIDRSEEYHAALASASRRQVLAVLLASPEPLDATTIASRLGLHVTTVRFHLDQLTGAGLAQRRAGAEKRRGRPRQLYAPGGLVRDEDAREQLVDVLAAALSLADDSNARALQAGRSWAAAFELPESDSQVSGLISVLDRLGFEPEPEADWGAIRLHACPFRDAARQHPEVVCAVHRGLIDEILAGTAPQARLIPFVEPELCLVVLDRNDTT